MNINLSARFLPAAITLSLFVFPAISCNPATDRNTVAGDRLSRMENRIQQLEDREEIGQLLMDYGRYLDERDFDSFSKLFAEEDGEWIGGMGKARGRRAIREFMEKEIGDNRGETATPNFHLFMNKRIDVDDDGASATSKWVFVIRDKEGQPQPFYLGHYEDRFVREKGQWRFLKRVVYSDIPKDKPEP